MQKLAAETTEMMQLYHAALCHANRIGRLVQDQFLVNSPEWTALHEMCTDNGKIGAAVYRWLQEDESSR